LNFRVIKKIICFDLDNVLCTTKNSDYKNSKPIKKNIKIVNQLYLSGYYIKIFTARYMGRYKENTKLVNKNILLTKKYLKKFNIKYHKLIMGKPSYDMFIDDKALFYKKNWSNYLKKKLL
jgi:capsule biosynthesis phosphatase